MSILNKLSKGTPPGAINFGAGPVFLDEIAADDELLERKTNNKDTPVSHKVDVVESPALRPQFYASLYGRISQGLFIAGWLVRTTMLLVFTSIFLVSRPIGIMLSSVFNLLAYAAWGLNIRFNNDLADKIEEPQLKADFLEYDDLDVGRDSFSKYAVWVGGGAFVCFLLYAVVAMTAICPPFAVGALVVGVWALVVSDALWVKGCQDRVNNRINNPLHSNQMGVLRQSYHKAYRNYALMLTIASLAVAVMLTLSLFCPPAGAFLALALVAMVSVKSAVGFSLGAVGIGFFVQSRVIKSKYMAEKKKVNNAADSTRNSQIEFDTLS